MMAGKTVGSVTSRIVGHSVKNRLNELHLSWTIDNWTEVHAEIAAAQPSNPVSYYDIAFWAYPVASSTHVIVKLHSPKVSSKQLGSSSKGSWRMGMEWQKHEQGVDQICPFLSLMFEDNADGTEQQQREMAYAQMGIKVFADFPPREVFEWEEEHPITWKCNYPQPVPLTYNAIRDRTTLDQIVKARSLVVEMELTFLQCPYRETFACMPCCIRLDPNIGLLDLYKTQTLTDFVFISSDEKELPVHRVMLAASCEVFKAMLTHDTKEKRTGICQLDDIDYETLQLVVDSFYGVEISTWSLRDPATLYSAADKYDLGKLKDFCRRPLEYTLTVKNAVDRYLFGLQYDLPDLIAKCVEFVRSNYDEFVENGGAAEVVEKLPDAHRDFFQMVGAWNGPTPTKHQRTK